MCRMTPFSQFYIDYNLLATGNVSWFILGLHLPFPPTRVLFLLPLYCVSMKQSLDFHPQNLKLFDVKCAAGRLAVRPVAVTLQNDGILNNRNDILQLNRTISAHFNHDCTFLFIGGVGGSSTKCSILFVFYFVLVKESDEVDGEYVRSAIYKLPPLTTSAELLTKESKIRFCVKICAHVRHTNTFAHTHTQASKQNYKHTPNNYKHQA